MNEPINEENNELAIMAYTQVIQDSNDWDLMTGTELNKRIRRYKTNECIENLISVLSCLRLADVYYFRHEQGDKWSIPIIELQGDPIAFAFSTPKHIGKDEIKNCKKAKMPFGNFLYSFKDAVKCVAINPNTDQLFFPVDMLVHFIQMMDNIEEFEDNKMLDGVDAEELDSLSFHRFWGRNIECQTTDGRTIIGNAGQCNRDGERFYLEVDTDADEPIRIYQEDVKFIKDLGFDEEDE